MIAADTKRQADTDVDSEAKVEVARGVVSGAEHTAGDHFTVRPQTRLSNKVPPDADSGNSPAIDDLGLGEDDGRKPIDGVLERAAPPALPERVAEHKAVMNRGRREKCRMGKHVSLREAHADLPGILWSRGLSDGDCARQMLLAASKPMTQRVARLLSRGDEGTVTCGTCKGQIRAGATKSKNSPLPCVRHYDFRNTERVSGPSIGAAGR